MKTVTVKKTSAILLGSLIAASIAISSFSPAYANDNKEQARKNDDRGRNEQGMKKRGPEGRGGFIHLICSEDGAAHLESALGKLDERITLTADQQALYATFKSAALTAQTSFADSCEKPARVENQKPNPVELLKARQVNMSAEIAAMDDVVPAFEAFFNSLTDDQKAEMKPPHRNGNGDRK